MKRNTAREVAVGLVYAMSVGKQPASELLDNFFEEEHYGSLGEEDGLYAQPPGGKQKNYIADLVRLTEEHLSEIDAYIGKYSVGWKPERITKTALAALRCALCEILYMQDVPNAVAINECVELSKGYDEEETVSFINGVLGAFMRGENMENSDG